ncbi:hypothetical protein GCM10020254_71280 [Streptomyces goshikiensis]
MTSVVLLGTLDTKGVEYGWLRERLLRAGVEVVLVDTGIMDEPRVPADIPREAVARAAGAELSELRAAADRGAAVTTMARGAEATLLRLHAEGRLDGVLAIGGSGGTSIASRAMRALPLGVPKLMVSSMASGNVAPYVGSSDITMMYSVVDIAGINSVSAPVLTNAVAAIAGMAKAFARSSSAHGPARLGAGGRPLIAASMAGVTTVGVDAARERLTELGYEVLVFHVSGTGGRTLETLAGQGIFAGVLDLTLSELADDLCGGVLSAGPDRLSAAGRAGIPQVVSLGGAGHGEVRPAGDPARTRPLPAGPRPQPLDHGHPYDRVRMRGTRPPGRRQTPGGDRADGGLPPAARTVHARRAGRPLTTTGARTRPCSRRSAKACGAAPPGSTTTTPTSTTRPSGGRRRTGCTT